MARRICLVLAAIIPLLFSACASKPPTSTKHDFDPPRLGINLNQGWKFIRQDVSGAEQTSFDDSAWESIDVPHTWNAEDGEDGPHDSKTFKSDYYRGIGWYRRHLSLVNHPELKGRSLFLRFDGASIVADVFVNGKPVGNHKGMFSAFCFDVTSFMNTDGDNVIAVRMNNAEDKDIPPLSADFTFFGGIYRGVNLLALNPLSVTPLDDASSGVYIKQESVTADNAAIQVTAKVHNSGSTMQVARVTVDVLDADGKTVSTEIKPGDIRAGETIDFSNTFDIPYPHLWNGRKDPYQYQVRVAVSDGSTVTDQVLQPLGIRFFRVDPDQGFILNGASYPLHGVNRHQDRPHKGWAISQADHEEDFNLIMEMGCTGIRLAHYQHAQEFYDLCDRGGLVVWAEACLVNEVTDSQAFDDVAHQQLRELIKQNYNHPSICFWSLFNELRDPGGVKGEQLEVQRRHQIDLVTSLNTLAHQLDLTRPTVGATNQPKADYPLNKITDVIAFNRYDGWYRKEISDWPKELDNTRAALPGRAIGMSEYGAGASIHMHEANPPKPPTSTVQPMHTEEWQCVVHEAAYNAMKQRPWLWGTFLWNMFDFAADNRHEGEHAGINDKGVVTYDRKTKKDVFYFYKANWTTDPFVYVTQRRWSPREVGKSSVKVYSNCDSVDLKVNGKSLGAKTNADHTFVWDDVKLNEGTNKLEAASDQGGKWFTDSCTVVYDPNFKQEIPTTSPVGSLP